MNGLNHMAKRRTIYIYYRQSKARAKTREMWKGGMSRIYAPDTRADRGIKRRYDLICCFIIKTNSEIGGKNYGIK